MRRLEFQKIRDLQVRRPKCSARPPYIAAASGLARKEGHLYVVADDELELAVFSLAHPHLGGELYGLSSGQLPEDPKARKKSKPDWEALLLLAPAPPWIHGSLLALPSGSRPNRGLGAQVGLGQEGLPVTAGIRTLDLSPLYAELSKTFGELNIEGAAIVGDRFKLFQRGNGASGENAVIELDLPEVLRALEGFEPWSAKFLRKIIRVELGGLGGVALSFTDATSLGDGQVLFLAAAEGGGSTYLDGACQGSVIGVLNERSELIMTAEISPRIKAEGVWAQASNSGIEVLLVTDGDDPTRAAELYRGTVPLD